MKVRWTEQAYARLAEIFDFIAVENPDAAAKLVDALIDRGDGLAKHPRRGRIVPELGNPEVRELVFRGYRLVYRVDANVIHVLTVFEGHRLLPIEDVETNED